LGRRTYPIPTAEMNVPKKANVRMTPKFLKKFSCILAHLKSGVVECERRDKRTRNGERVREEGYELDEQVVEAQS